VFLKNRKILEKAKKKLARVYCRYSSHIRNDRITNIRTKNEQNQKSYELKRKKNFFIKFVPKWSAQKWTSTETG